MVNFNEVTFENIVKSLIELNDEKLVEFETLLRTSKKERTATRKLTIKEEKKKTKEDREISGRLKVQNIGIGGDITVQYKGNETTGMIIKISEKTFTITFDLDGEKKNLFRYYDQVVV